MLAEVIEKSVGKNYSEIVNEQVIKKLGLADTHTHVSFETHFQNQTTTEIDDAITKTLNADAYVTASLASYGAISMV